jgi:hypothetical protein
MWSRVDEFDRSPAERTTFGFLGKAYVLDLGDSGKKKLETALRPFLAVAEAYGDLPAPPDEDAPAAQPDGAAKNGNGNGHGAAAPRAARRRRSVAVTDSRKPTDAEVRAWAGANGHVVPTRGRLSREVMEAYEAANA